MSVDGRGAGDRMQFRNIVTLGQGMHPERRRRDRRLTQGKSWGRSRVQKRNAKALANEDQRKGCSTDTRTQDRNIDLKRFGLFHGLDANIGQSTIQSNR